MKLDIPLLKTEKIWIGFIPRPAKDNFVYEADNILNQDDLPQ